MTDVAIVAYRTEQGIRGVYQHDAPEPWTFGNLLLLEVLDRAGDLGRVVEATIDDAPGGWQSFAEDIRRPARGKTTFVDLDVLDAAPVAWLYVFEIDARRLDVWASPSSQKLGAPTLTINFDAGGHASPPVFETPRPEQPAGRILPAWDGDQKQDRQLRQRIANELPAPTHPETRAWFEEELEDVLSELHWVSFEYSKEERQLRHRLDVSTPSTLSLWPSAATFWAVNPDERPARKYWRLRIGSYTVNYPASSERVDDDNGSTCVLLRNDGAFAECPPLAAAFPLDQDAVATRFTDAVTRAIAGPKSRFEYHPPDIFVLKKVVQKVREPDCEVTLDEGRAFDANCGIGEVLGWNVPPYGGYWTLFDWIRWGQVPSS